MADAILTPGCLYRLIFPNGKSYIGITKRTASIRFAQHIKSSRIVNTQCAVHLAIAKYGADNVIVETLLIADARYRIDIEKMAIISYGTMAPNGYNLTSGGEGVCGFNEITRAKMGAANKGKKMSQETKAKISAARTGKIYPSAETREKIGAAFRGKVLSHEHREKIGAAQRGIKMSGARLESHLAAHKGKIVSAETRALIGSYHKGKTISAEHRAAISAAFAKKRADKIKQEVNP